MPNWNDSREVELIKCYRQQQCLWKHTSPSYKNFQHKIAAWKKIVSTLQSLGVDTTVEDTKNRMRSIRDSYGRHRKNVPAGSSHDEALQFMSTAYKYGPLLAFLDREIRPRRKLHAAREVSQSSPPPSTSPTHTSDNVESSENDSSSHLKHEADHVDPDASSHCDQFRPMVNLGLTVGLDDQNSPTIVMKNYSKRMKRSDSTTDIPEELCTTISNNVFHGEQNDNYHYLMSKKALLDRLDFKLCYLLKQQIDNVINDFLTDNYFNKND